MEADKTMLMEQLNALVQQMGEDQETMEIYKGKIAELEATRRANLELQEALKGERTRAESAERRLNSVATDAETAARAIGDQMVREKVAKEEAESKLVTFHQSVAQHHSEAAAIRAENERLRSENERLRVDLKESRDAQRLAEEKRSESDKILHVMRAEANATESEKQDLVAKVAALAATMARVRSAENEASVARCALDTEVAALSHAIQMSTTNGPPIIKPHQIPPMPVKLPGHGRADGPPRARTPQLGSARNTPRRNSPPTVRQPYGRQQ